MFVISRTTPHAPALADWVVRTAGAAYQESLGPHGLDVSRLRRAAMLDDPRGEIWSAARENQARAAARVHPCEWDGPLLRTSVWRLSAFAADSADAGAALLTEMMRDRRGLAVARVRGDAYALVHALERSGFQTMDTMNIVVKDLSGGTIEPGASLDVQPQAPGAPTEDLVSLAATAFTHSRLYHDPRIEPGRAEAFYAAFARDLLASGDRVAFVARCDGVAVGFIVGEVDSELTFQDGARLGYLSLIAVHPAAAGTGIGRTLLAELERAMASRVRWMEVGTQTHNTAALNLYARAGYRFTASLLTLHRWSS